MAEIAHVTGCDTFSPQKNVDASKIISAFDTISSIFFTADYFFRRRVERVGTFHVCIIFINTSL